MFRLLLHVPVGIAIGLLGILQPIYALCLTLLFIVYELNEDRHIKDQAWKDVIGAMVGLCLFLVLLLPLIFRVVKVFVG